MNGEWLAERFEADRTRLHAVAYRLLGSASEADDAVQEAWLRLSRSDTSEVENLSGWLTTVTARICLDMLRSRRSRSPFLPVASLRRTNAPCIRAGTCVRSRNQMCTRIHWRPA